MHCIRTKHHRLGPCLLAVLMGSVVSTTAALAQTGPQAKLKTIELTAGMHVIHTELAITPEEQATGMMFRRGMGSNDGMLFVYADSGKRCFWMRNTLVPLTIAFIATDGTVVNFADMAPLDEQSHCSEKPVQYALEVPQGWFAKRGFKPGLKLRGAPFSKP
jgi:uncharacterized protein